MSSSTRRHFMISFKKACRHRGHPFARQLAYIGRTKAYDPRTATTYNFCRKSGIEACELMGFDGSPEELISEVVFSGQPRRKKVVEGREIIVAFAPEFSAAERLKLARKCARYLIRKFGVALFFAVHPPAAKGDDRNFHMHILATARRVIGGTRLGEKTRELDSLVTGGRHVEAFRGWWTGLQNKMLRKGGHLANLSHKSFERLGISGEPGKHLGERRTAIRRRHSLRKLPVASAPAPVRTLPPLSIPRIATQTTSAPAPSIPAVTQLTAPRPPVQFELFTPKQGDCPRDDHGLPIPRTPVPAAVPVKESEAPPAEGMGKPFRIPKLSVPKNTMEGPTPSPG